MPLLFLRIHMLLNKLINKKRTAYLDKFYELISDYEILSHYLGHEIKINRAIHSPLRASDENPSLLLYIPTKLADIRENSIWFKDMMLNEYGTTLRFVKLFVKHNYNIDLNSNYEIVRYIDTDLGLGLYGDAKVDRTRLQYTLPDKTPKEIFYQSRPFTDKDLKYWGNLGVSENILNEYNIKSVKYILDAQGRPYKEFYKNDLVYAYVIWDKVKIYRPHASKADKFRNSCPGDDYVYYQGYKQLKYHKVKNNKLIITKSMKDVVVFTSLAMKASIESLDVIAPHAESNYVNKEFIGWALKTYEDIIVVSDFDYAGIKFSQNCRNNDRSKIRYKFTDSSRHFINNKLKVIDKDISDYTDNNGISASVNLIKSWYFHQL